MYLCSSSVTCSETFTVQEISLKTLEIYTAVSPTFVSNKTSFKVVF